MNSAFTSYDLATGQVQFSGTSYNPATMATESMGILLGVAHDGGWLADGVHYPQPARPSAHHTFDWTGKAWIDPRTLQDLKDAKWADIKRARDAAELGPFTYNGMEFDGDLNAQRRLAAYISVSKSAIAAGREFVAEFTLADDTQVTLNAQDFVGIELAKVQSVATAFAHAAALRAQIDAALTPETVAAITW